MKSILFVFALPGEEEHFEMFPFSKSSLLLMMLIGSRTFEFSCFADDSDWFLSLLQWREKAFSHLKSKFEFFSFRSLRWWLQTHIFSHHQPMRGIHQTTAITFNESLRAFKKKFSLFNFLLIDKNSSVGITQFLLFSSLSHNPICRQFFPSFHSARWLKVSRNTVEGGDERGRERGDK